MSICVVYLCECLCLCLGWMCQFLYICACALMMMDEVQTGVGRTGRKMGLMYKCM